jgi:hypothetical protein
MTGASFFDLILLFLGLVSTGGLILLAFGIRGQPSFAAPRCRKCNYDLRGLLATAPASLGACPECGAGLDSSDAVSFGRWRRHGRMIVLGVMVMILPWAAGLALTLFRASVTATAFARTSPMNRSTMSVPALLASLRTTVTSPWDWQELQRRLAGGSLTSADAASAVNVLINYLKSENAIGRPRKPLNWPGPFLQAAIARGYISKPQLTTLCQSFYNDSPDLVLRDRFREGEVIHIGQQHSAQPWNLSGMKLCWSLESVVADHSIPLSPTPTYGKNSFGSDLPSGTGPGYFQTLDFSQQLPVGEHQLTFSFVLGTVSDQATFRGTDGKPGTPDKWPNPFCTWKRSFTKKITVVRKDQPVISMVSDDALDPAKTMTLQISEALMRPSSRGAGEIALKWKPSGACPAPISMRVTIRAGDRSISAGAFTYKSDGGSASWGYGGPALVKQPLPPGITTIDVLMTPDPKALEDSPTVNRIWGKPIRINDVPLERFDLKPSPSTLAP